MADTLDLNLTGRAKVKLDEAHYKDVATTAVKSKAPTIVGSVATGEDETDLRRVLNAVANRLRGEKGVAKVATSIRNHPQDEARRISIVQVIN